MFRNRPRIGVLSLPSLLLLATSLVLLGGCEDMFNGTDTTPGGILTGSQSEGPVFSSSESSATIPSEPEDSRWVRACADDCLHFETCEPQAFDATYQSLGDCQRQCERAVAASEADLTPACLDSQLDRLTCATELSCFEREIFEAGSPQRPCSAEDFEAVVACAPAGASPASLCEADCAQFALCTPEEFGEAHGNEASCLQSCQADIAEEFENTTIGCFISSYQRLECTAELGCEEFDAAWEGEAGAPCSAALDAFFLQCDIQVLCAQDCLQLESCYPETYNERYANAELCIGRCANQVADAAAANTPSCVNAQIALFACTTALECEDADAYFGGEPDAPCLEENEALQAACPN